jgi:hypothetical protein
MTIKTIYLLAVLLAFGVIPQLLFIDAYAKWPINNFEHEMGQYARLLLIPMAITIVLMGVWRIRSGEHGKTRRAILNSRR